MNEALARQIRTAPNLPSLPAIAIQILDLAQRPEVDMAEIARIISKDPALSGKILRTVNSSFYARSNNVGTISHALVILGLQSVKTLVLGFSLVSQLSKDKSKGFHHIAYWKRSIFAATAARVLVARINLAQQEEAFLATLLADIGMLVLDRVVGDAYGAVHEKVTSHEQLCASEQATLGATHAEVGGMLAETWKLPPTLAVPIANHHTPAQVKDPLLRQLAEIVQLAGRCADVFTDEQAAPAITDVRRLCLEQHKIVEADCDALLDEIGKRTREAAGLFEVNLGSLEEYEAVLKRANDALVEITLQTQQHATTLAQQATNLAQQNVQLQQQASTDGLTGLANRARFDLFLAQHLSAAVAAQCNLALLMIDLDGFKSVNDQFGHPVGDAVLKTVASLLRAGVRKQDLAARYGGDEMAVVLPGASRAQAAALAESLRRTIAAKAIPAGRGSVRPTVSIGVALHEPNSPLRTPALLIKAADLGIYSAKKAGRNCVKIFALKTPIAPAVQAAEAPQASHSVGSEPSPATTGAAATQIEAKASEATTGASVGPAPGPMAA